MTRQQWQATFWVNRDSPEPIVQYGESHAALHLAVRAWLDAHQPAWFSSCAPSAEQRHQVTYAYAPAPVDREGCMAEDTAYAQAHPWRCWHGLSDMGRSTFAEARDHFTSWLPPAMGPEFANALFAADGAFIEQHIRSVRECQPSNVNAYLARGWAVKGTNERLSAYGERSIAFVLVHAEDNAV